MNHVVVGWLITILFTLVSIVNSIHLILRHLQNYTRRVYQRQIIRILFMVPIYSISAFLTYAMPQLNLYFDLIRSLYESFVIYEFFNLLLAYLGETNQERVNILSTKESRNLLFPFHLISFEPSSPFFIMDTKIAILQYVVIRPLLTFFAIFLELNGRFHSETLLPIYGFFWYVFVGFISASIALYALGVFFVVIREDIKQYRPITKFLSVKFVIFMTFFQGLIIGICASQDLLPENLLQYWTKETLAIGFNQILIVLEMFIASFWHFHSSCFGYFDFVSPTGNKTDIWLSLLDSFNPKDTLVDIWRGIKHVFYRLYLYIKTKQQMENSSDDELIRMRNIEENRRTDEESR
jgi:hypothetical protein